MSADGMSDDADDLDLPAAERDAVSTGGAADWDERLKGLPRLLRYAMLVSDNASHIEQRLIAEIDELCPNLPLNAAWAAAPNVDTRRRHRPHTGFPSGARVRPFFASKAGCAGTHACGHRVAVDHRLWRWRADALQSGTGLLQPLCRRLYPRLAVRLVCSCQLPILQVQAFEALAVIR